MVEGTHTLSGVPPPSAGLLSATSVTSATAHVPLSDSCKKDGQLDVCRSGETKIKVCKKTGEREMKIRHWILQAAGGETPDILLDVDKIILSRWAGLGADGAVGGTITRGIDEEKVRRRHFQ